MLRIDFTVLGAIERGNASATPTQIAGELELRSSNLAQVLGSLNERGLIQRHCDPADKRKTRLSLTGQGPAKAHPVRFAYEDLWRRPLDFHAAKQRWGATRAAGSAAGEAAYSRRFCSCSIFSIAPIATGLLK